jgi:hypothetical protein
LAYSLVVTRGEAHYQLVGGRLATSDFAKSNITKPYSACQVCGYRLIPQHILKINPEQVTPQIFPYIMSTGIFHKHILLTGGCCCGAVTYTSADIPTSLTSCEASS